jgi:predicted flap endonuclease-1-like 5' DNA nuclease
MQLDQIWFVVAGFLLGFTVSTLWEWFHSRQERLKLRDRRIAELEAKLRERERFDEGRSFDLEQVRWSQPEYRSPGVFLETEDAGLDQEPPQPEPVAEPSPASVALSARPAMRATTDPAVNTNRSAGADPLTVTPDVQPLSGPAIQPTTRPTLPISTPKRSDNYPDDLCKIKGIGDVYKLRLYSAGIFTWHQIANSDPDTLRAATRAYPSSNVEEWPEQARQLAEKQGRQGAVYTGPPPDDLCKILGIGPVGRQTLYKAGICTYEQLAAAIAGDLGSLFPIAVAGDQPDFEGWIRQAKLLASARRKS